jgi:hypothetical protein
MRGRRILGSLWVGLMFIGTGLAVFWVVYIGMLWGIVIGDINPDRMPPLTEKQAEVVFQQTRSIMLLAALPPLFISVAWAVTVAVMLIRPQEQPGS